MTVNELIDYLQQVKTVGGGQRIVRMGDPTNSEYVEVTGIWIPQDEQVVDLEAVEWEIIRKEKSH